MRGFLLESRLGGPLSILEAGFGNGEGGLCFAFFRCRGGFRLCSNPGIRIALVVGCLGLCGVYVLCAVLEA